MSSKDSFKLLLSIFLMAFTGLNPGCVSTSQVASDYKKFAKSKPNLTVPQTNILFLVDGLSHSTLQSLPDEELKNISSFFSSSKKQYGRAVFPSLTFPNLVSILTLNPVANHWVNGNQVVFPFASDDDKYQVFDFETPLMIKALNKAIEPYLIFSQLKAQNRYSVSLAQSLTAGATAQMAPDFEFGINYANQDFESIDDKTIKSLETLLSDMTSAQWPDFIFVHLVGVDALSHLYGPDSSAVLKYIKRLDKMLGKSFKLIRKTEDSNKKIVTLFTSDHGFIKIKKQVNLNKKIYDLNPKIQVVNEGRLAGLFLPPKTNEMEQKKILKKISTFDFVQMTIFRSQNTVYIQKNHDEWSFSFTEGSCPPFNYKLTWQNKSYCPQELDQNVNFMQLPYFFENVSSYFYSPLKSRALVLAQSGVSFKPSDEGYHGGLTAEEVLTPLFIRGATIPLEKPVPVYDLLRFVISVDNPNR